MAGSTSPHDSSSPDDGSPEDGSPEDGSPDARTPPDSDTPASDTPDSDTPASDREGKRARQRLLAPIGGLYALAQTLTRSEPEAHRLVEATYARAAEALDAGEAPSSGTNPRPWLCKLLVRTARQRAEEEKRPAEAASDGPAARQGTPDHDRHFRRRVQRRFLRRALPPAFASLSPAQRLLLLLCDMEQLTEDEAADVAALSPESLRRRHARARADLRDALRQMAPRPERPFLEEGDLTDTQLRSALRRMGKRDFSAPPPALRPSARHALRHEREAPHKREAPHEAAGDSPAASSQPAAQAMEEAPGTPWAQRVPRLLVALLLIAVTGSLGYLATAVLDRPGETDLAALSVQKASGVDARLRTESPERAEQFVRDRLGRRLTVPHIEGAALEGVGLAEVVPGERVPVFLFRDSASGRPLTAYAYDYAVLDRAEGRLRLPSALRRQLTEEGHFASQTVEEHRVLFWRHRDDIFAAVTGRTDSLRQRIAL